MKKLHRINFLLIFCFLGGMYLTSCSEDTPEPTCSTPNLSSMFIGISGTFDAMTSAGANSWSYEIQNYQLNTLTFIFANNGSGNNATFGIAPGAASTPNSGTAVQKIVDGTLTCGDNSPLVLDGVNGKNITITFNSSSLQYSIQTEDFDPCTQFSRENFYIRWRNSSNAGDFTWDAMSPVAGSDGVFQISQPANVFYLEGEDEPNFGAQILEFSNQPDYGGLNNGELWPLYRNGNTDWTFPVPVNGVTSKTALYISVSVRNAQGEETVICPRPEEVTQNRGFRLLFQDEGEFVIQKTNTLRYVIDTFTGEVALFIE